MLKKLLEFIKSLFIKKEIVEEVIEDVLDDDIEEEEELYLMEFIPEKKNMSKREKKKLRNENRKMKNDFKENELEYRSKLKKQSIKYKSRRERKSKRKNGWLILKNRLQYNLQRSSKGGLFCFWYTKL